MNGDKAFAILREQAAIDRSIPVPEGGFKAITFTVKPRAKAKPAKAAKWPKAPDYRREHRSARLHWLSAKTLGCEGPQAVSWDERLLAPTTEDDWHARTNCRDGVPFVFPKDEEPEEVENVPVEAEAVEASVGAER